MIPSAIAIFDDIDNTTSCKGFGHRKVGQIYIGWWENKTSRIQEIIWTKWGYCQQEKSLS